MLPIKTFKYLTIERALAYSTLSPDIKEYLVKYEPKKLLLCIKEFIEDSMKEGYNAINIRTGHSKSTSYNIDQEGLAELIVTNSKSKIPYITAHNLKG